MSTQNTTILKAHKKELKREVALCNCCGLYKDVKDMSTTPIISTEPNVGIFAGTPFENIFPTTRSFKYNICSDCIRKETEIADNPNTPQATLKLLSKDKNEHVRYGVARNPHYIKRLSFLRKLIRSQWWWVVIPLLWYFVILRVLPGLVNFLITLDLTLIIPLAWVVEYLTRPAQKPQKPLLYLTRPAQKPQTSLLYLTRPAQKPQKTLLNIMKYL